jgi:hypothetical protein
MTQGCGHGVEPEAEDTTFWRRGRLFGDQATKFNITNSIDPLMLKISSEVVFEARQWARRPTTS